MKTNFYLILGKGNICRLNTHHMPFVVLGALYYFIIIFLDIWGVISSQLLEVRCPPQHSSFKAVVGHPSSAPQIWECHPDPRASCLLESRLAR